MLSGKKSEILPLMCLNLPNTRFCEQLFEPDLNCSYFPIVFLPSKKCSVVIFDGVIERIVKLAELNLHFQSEFNSSEPVNIKPYIATERLFVSTYSANWEIHIYSTAFIIYFDDFRLLLERFS